VSSDGTVVVGESGGRAFIWRGEIEDLENLGVSFGALASDIELIHHEQQFALGQLMVERGLAENRTISMEANVSRFETSKNPESFARRKNTLSSLSFGYGVSPTLTIGASIARMEIGMQSNALDMDDGVAKSLWFKYSQSGSAGHGLQLSGAISKARGTGYATRGRTLEDVKPAAGKTTFVTDGMRFNIGYGIQNRAWLVTPKIGLSHYRTRQSSYSEAGGNFNAAYDRLRSDVTVASAEVTGSVLLTDTSRLKLGMKVDHELSRRLLRLKGQSEIPGLASFDISSGVKPNRTRVSASLEHTHYLTQKKTISTRLELGRARYGREPYIGLSVGLSARF
jgi:hypothetical protein